MPLPRAPRWHALTRRCPRSPRAASDGAHSWHVSDDPLSRRADRVHSAVVLVQAVARCHRQEAGISWHGVNGLTGRNKVRHQPISRCQPGHLALGPLESARQGGWRRGRPVVRDNQAVPRSRGSSLRLRQVSGRFALRARLCTLQLGFHRFQAVCYQVMEPRPAAEIIKSAMPGARETAHLHATPAGRDVMRYAAEAGKTGTSRTGR